MKRLLPALSLSLLWLTPEVAAALSCRAPPPFSVYYPREKATAPRNAAIFVFVRSGKRPRGLRLIDRTTKATWPVMALWSDKTRMLRLIPRPPLAANHRYQLLLGRRLLRTFTTSAKLAPAGRPRLARGKVRISKWIVPRWVAPGRSGAVKLRSLGGAAARFVGVHARYWPPGKRLIDTRFSRAYAPLFHFAQTDRCGVSGATLAPRRGRYAVTLIPWSVTGAQGQPLRLRGRLR